MPRNRTLVITPWGLSNEIPNSDSYNIYQVGVGHQRESGSKTIYEALMYTNLNTGEIIPGRPPRSNTTTTLRRSR